MASSGQFAFEKYFQNKEIKTTIKNDTFLLNFNNRKIDTIKTGEDIIVLPSEIYNTKQNILYKNDVYKVLFSKIAKPRYKSTIKVKPQDFDLSNVYTSSDLASYLIEEQIPNRNELPEEIKKYLISLTLYYGFDKEVKCEIPLIGINEIQKDYSEILGALACVKKNILPLEIYKNTLIEFPENGSEPLIDYILHSKKSHKISAKSGNISNLIKPIDILYLANGKLKEFAKLIVENSVISFPFKANEKYFKEKIVGPRSSKELKELGNLFYQIEKKIITYANENFSIDEIVRKLLNEVHYVKFIFKNTSYGNFAVLNKQNYSGAKWASKNYALRASDKIGIRI